MPIPWNEWAFDAGQVVPAQLVSQDDRAIDALVVGSHSRSIYTGSGSPSLNALEVYPAIRVDPQPSDWYIRDEPSDTFAYIVDPDDITGLLYEITQAWEFMTYNDARSKARLELGVYYRNYVASQFDAGADTFPADVPSTLGYLTIDAIVGRGGYSGGQFVFDITGLSHPVASQPAWESFWDSYVVLFDEARQIVGTAWNDVQGVATTAEVETIMDALPPIPGA